MEPQTSFIPKKPLAKELTPVPVREAPIGLFTLLTTILFFLSALAGGAAYFYRALLERDINNKSVSLERAEKAFEPSTIVELERLDRRIESAKQILNRHVLVTPVFRFLEQSTIPNIRYDRFEYEFPTITAHGQARSYAYVASQSDVFGESKYVSDHIFSNLNLDSQGNVTFDLVLTLDPSFLLYKENLQPQS